MTNYKIQMTKKRREQRREDRGRRAKRIGQSAESMAHSVGRRAQRGEGPAEADRRA